MMTPWGRTGGSQENVRDLGPLADIEKFAGGLPGARGGPTNTNTKYGNKYTTRTLCCNVKTYILKSLVINSRASSVVSALLAGGPSPALLPGNTRQV